MKTDAFKPDGAFDRCFVQEPLPASCKTHAGSLATREITPLTTPHFTWAGARAPAGLNRWPGPVRRYPKANSEPPPEFLSRTDIDSLDPCGDIDRR